MLERKDDTDWIKRCMLMDINETGHKGHKKKTLWDYVGGDMESVCLSHQDAQDKDRWGLRIGGYRLTRVYLEDKTVCAYCPHNCCNCV